VAIIPNRVIAGNEAAEAILSLGRSLQSGRAITDIAGDNTAGAAEILLRAAEVYAQLSLDQRNRKCSSAGHATRRVIKASVELLESQPAMAPLARLASRAAEAAAQSTCADEALERALAAARSFANAAVRSGEAAAAHTATLIGDESRMFTHSRSSTVLLVIKLALKAGKRLAVIATESRPMMEGRALAAELSCLGANVTLIADADAAGGIEQADLVLLGADALTPSHVVNKIGTRLIALAARELGKPAYVVCDTSKFITSTKALRGLRSRQDSAELWPDPPDGVDVMNTYFEATPLSLFTTIITEHGAARPEEAARLAKEFVLNDGLLEATDRAGRSL
jgi:translation initiation factor 2B subunit (eIF-2B alpha/beta/delta family)